MFDETAREALNRSKIYFELPIVLIDRGNCSFVTKVRNVEKAGGSVALIGD